MTAGRVDNPSSYTARMKIQPLALLVAVSVPLAAQAPPSRVNPLLSRSSLPFQAPPFDRITDADYEPAIAEGIRQRQAEIARIAGNTAAPTFATMVERFAIRGRSGKAELADPQRAGGSLTEAAVDTPRRRRRQTTIVAPRATASPTRRSGVTSRGGATACGSRSACEVTQFWQ